MNVRITLRSAARRARKGTVATALGIGLVLSAGTPSWAGGHSLTFEDQPSQWVQIAHGGVHSLAVDSQGRVYSWGYNVCGVLGTGKRSGALRAGESVPFCLPKRVHTPYGLRFHKVAAGERHSLALSRDNTVYVWGSNSNYQLALCDRSAERSVPTPLYTGSAQSHIRSMEKIVDIAAYQNHSFALTATGSVIGWGHDLLYRTSRPHVNTHILPRKIALPTQPDDHIIRLSSDHNYSAAFSRAGRIYCWGLSTQHTHCSLRSLLQSVQDAPPQFFEDLAAAAQSSTGTPIDAPLYFRAATDPAPSDDTPPDEELKIKKITVLSFDPPPLTSAPHPRITDPEIIVIDDDDDGYDDSSEYEPIASPIVTLIEDQLSPIEDQLLSPIEDQLPPIGELPSTQIWENQMEQDEALDLRLPHKANTR